MIDEKIWIFNYHMELTDWTSPDQTPKPVSAALSDLRQ